METITIMKPLHALENRYEVMDVRVDVKLTIMKQLRVKWLPEFYNYINSSDVQEITRWLRAVITDAINQNYLHSILCSSYAAIL